MSYHPILAHITENLSPLINADKAMPLKRWVVAYSGGVDSTVLLHSVIHFNQKLRQPLPVIALHINHQLSPNALVWQQHCQKIAQSLGIGFVAHNVDVQAMGYGIEAAARDARYSVFEQFLNSEDCLLLGQHRGDQAETFLLRLLRGAGVRGLSGMTKTRKIGSACLVRPMLNSDKSDILDYAHSNHLNWIEDESNHNDDFDRNFLRNNIVPLLEKRWPVAINKLTETAVRMRQADILLSELAQTDLHHLGVKQERWGFSVDLKALSSLSYARRNNVLRHWCEQQSYPVLEENHLVQIQQQFFDLSSLLSSACVSWKGHELRQFSDRLYLMPALPDFDEKNNQYVWNTDSELLMGSAGKLVLGGKGSVLVLPKRHYTIQWRQGGERCTPKDRQHSQTVKKLLQEYGLETWLRDRVPLIYCNNQLAAVGDLWVNKGYDVDNVEVSIAISWII